MLNTILGVVLIVCLAIIVISLIAEGKTQFTWHLPKRKYFTAGIYLAFGLGITEVDFDGTHHIMWLGPISFAYGDQGEGQYTSM